ncbi:MAG: phytanoyl-CoA dioxygenase family protein [Microthrixaceae bacterium]
MPSDPPDPDPLRCGPSLERLPADTTPDKLLDVIERDGAVVLEGVLERHVAAAIDAELASFVAARKPGFAVDGDDAFYGANTVRIQGLAAKSPTWVRELLAHPTLLSVAEGVLTDHCGDFWLSQAETIFIGPGEPAQEMHRDDLNWATAARLGIPLQVSVLTALGDYDAAVGATRVIPGSHRMPDDPVGGSVAVPAELGIGDSLVYVGALVHGGGANTTDDRVRKGLYQSYLVGWLTPEEAVSRSVDARLAASLPERARRLLGWGNLRGNPTNATGAAAALKLWQLDAGDHNVRAGVFTHR